MSKTGTKMCVVLEGYGGTGLTGTSRYFREEGGNEFV